MTAPGNHHTIIVEECPHCDGAGWIEGEVIDICRVTGAPLSQAYRCSACKGSGEIETEYECRTLEDVEQEAAEERGEPNKRPTP